MENLAVLWSGNKYFRPLVIISCFLILFGSTFKPLHAIMKDGAFIISSSFPILAGWLLGLRLGQLYWLLHSVLLMILAQAVGSSIDELISNGIPLYLITLIITSAMGKISDLTKTLKYELKERKQIESELHQHKGTLEKRVKEQTEDLIRSNEQLKQEILHNEKANKEKLRAQKNANENKELALVGQIAGKMAHDFNNILGIIMGNTELSLIDCKDDQIKKTFELIYEQTLRGKNLTKDLVAFAKDQEPKQEFFGINNKIELVFNLMRKDLDGIELIKEEEPDIPDLLADPGMIEHAIVNLLQNSIHALSRVEKPQIITRTYCLDDKIYFELEDNGCGIPNEHLENIFEPSFTLKGNNDVTGSYKNDLKGTGYGLYNVKKYIKRHNGNILVDSKYGSGTKFTISLPVFRKELTTKEKKELSNSVIIHYNKQILLVEDEIAILDVQNRMLVEKPWNHKVDTAQNGQVAIELIGKNKYDLISLDYTLPGKINGMDIYHHIRETYHNIPILFISGNLEFLESIKDLKQKDACADYLSKPCKNLDYLNCINKLLVECAH